MARKGLQINFVNGMLYHSSSDAVECKNTRWLLCLLIDQTGLADPDPQYGGFGGYEHLSIIRIKCLN